MRRTDEKPQTRRLLFDSRIENRLHVDAFRNIALAHCAAFKVLPVMIGTTA
jgi:hypothetical protein